MNIRVCDYCGSLSPQHNIRISRRVNDEDVFIEICSNCLYDIENYIEESKQ